MTSDMENVVVLFAFFASVFIGGTGLAFRNPVSLRESLEGGR